MQSGQDCIEASTEVQGSSQAQDPPVGGALNDEKRTPVCKDTFDSHSTIAILWLSDFRHRLVSGSHVLYSRRK